MTDEDPIICRPTKWFLWRAAAMLLMFGVFFVLFMKDWRVGYPQKNVVFYTYQAFERAKVEFAEREKAGQIGADWEVFAEAQQIPYPDEAGILPAGVDPEGPWPAELRNYEGYREVFLAEKDKAVPPGWLEYSNAQGWDSKTPEHGYEAAKIREQLYYGIGAGVLTVLALFYLFRTQSRSMSAGDDGFDAPGGPHIPYDRMRRIDKRKWESKGLAFVHYEAENGELKKAKVDGMVYGQFREEDGAPAERLFQRVLRNFSGELVELEGLPEDETPGDGGAGAPEDEPD